MWASAGIVFPLHAHSQTRAHTHTQAVHTMSAWFICHKSKQARAHARRLYAQRVRERASERIWRKGWVICLAATLLFIWAVVLRSLALSLTQSCSFLATHSLSRLLVLCVSVCEYLCALLVCVCVCMAVRSHSLLLSLSHARSLSGWF